MQYLSQSDETLRASALYSDIYLFKFHEIRFRGNIVMANYMDFKSIQGL